MASITDQADLLEEERQVQEAIRLSLLGRDTDSHQLQPDTAGPSKKRGWEEDLERTANKRSRPASTASRSSILTTSFRNGALRITRTPGRQNDKNCINLGDVIHKEHLVSACIFSFFIANDELFRHLPLSASSNDVPVSEFVTYLPDDLADSASRSTSVEIPIQIWMRWWLRQRLRQASPSATS